MRILGDDPSPGCNKLGPYSLANASKGNGQFWEEANPFLNVMKNYQL
jgi:hypothetical protein